MSFWSAALAHLGPLVATARLRVPAAARSAGPRRPAPTRGGGAPPRPEVATRARWATGVILVLGSLGALLAPGVGTLASMGCVDGGGVLCSAPVFLLLTVGSLPALLVALVLTQRAGRRARPDGGHGTVHAAWGVWVGWCVLWWALLFLVVTYA